LNLLSRKKSKP